MSYIASLLERAEKWMLDCVLGKDGMGPGLATGSQLSDLTDRAHLLQSNGA